MEQLEHLISTYGYLALFIGTFLEGETILIIAGIAAHQGLLNTHLVALSAFLGSLSGDQLYFFIGRYRGKWLLARRPAWIGPMKKVLAKLERHSTWLLLGFRFLYGLRTVTPLAVGMSRVSIPKFACLNVIGAVVWALSFCWGGYLFGEALMRLMENFKKYERMVLALACVAAVVFWLLGIWRKRRAAKKEPFGPAILIDEKDKPPRIDSSR